MLAHGGGKGDRKEVVTGKERGNKNSEEEEEEEEKGIPAPPATLFLSGNRGRLVGGGVGWGGAGLDWLLGVAARGVERERERECHTHPQQP